VARGTGVFRFYTTAGSTGAQLDSGDMTWKGTCDPNAKMDNEPVDCRGVLNKLAQWLERGRF
jgi:hypothetical protein